MKLAIMQPYFLPYIGYWQLLHSVDRFIVLDDVHFINRGWINRNRILVGGKDHLFTIPLKGASQNRLINELEIADDNRWRDKLLKTLTQAYARAPHFSSLYPMVEGLIQFKEQRLTLFLLHSLNIVTAFLRIPTQIVASSSVYANRELKGTERILDICRHEGATEYVNPPGGKDLYDHNCFAAAGVRLRFLKPGEITYRQHGETFVPWLSILDVMMFNNIEQVKGLLDSHSLD